MVCLGPPLPSKLLGCQLPGAYAICQGLMLPGLHAEAGGFLVQRKAAAVRKRKAAKEDADGPMGEAQTGSAEADEGNTEVVSPAAQQPSAEQEGPGAQVADKADAGDTGSEAGVQTPFGLDGRQRQDPLDDRDDEEVRLRAGGMQHTSAWASSAATHVRCADVLPADPGA